MKAVNEVRHDLYIIIDFPSDAKSKNVCRINACNQVYNLLAQDLTDNKERPSRHSAENV